jgi:hypothetical protein
MDPSESHLAKFSKISTFHWINRLNHFLLAQICPNLLRMEPLFSTKVPAKERSSADPQACVPEDTCNRDGHASKVFHLNEI